MDKDKDHIKDAQAYQRYLNGEMTPKERHAFEKRLLDDEFEQDALDGLSRLSNEQLAQDLKVPLNGREIV